MRLSKQTRAGKYPGRSLTSLLNDYLATGAAPRLNTRTLNPGFFPTARAETEVSAKLDQQLEEKTRFAILRTFRKSASYQNNDLPVGTKALKPPFTHFSPLAIS